MTSELEVNKFDNSLTLALSSPCLCCHHFCVNVYLFILQWCESVHQYHCLFTCRLDIVLQEVDVISPDCILCLSKATTWNLFLSCSCHRTLVHCPLCTGTFPSLYWYNLSCSTVTLLSCCVGIYLFMHWYIFFLDWYILSSCTVFVLCLRVATKFCTFISYWYSVFCLLWNILSFLYFFRVLKICFYLHNIK